MGVGEVFDPRLTPLSLSKQHFEGSYQKNRGGKGIKKSGFLLERLQTRVHTTYMILLLHVEFYYIHDHCIKYYNQ